jgi:hypothetical protein
MAPRKGQQFAAEAQLLKSMSTLSQRDVMKSHLSSLMNSQRSSREPSAPRAPAPPARQHSAHRRQAEGISMSDLHKAVNALANAPALLLSRKRPVTVAADQAPDSELASKSSARSSVAKSSGETRVAKVRRLETKKDGSALFQGLTSIPLDDRLRAAGDGDVLPASRCAVAPLWSLVGTFKVALTSVVDIDLTERAVKWHQRNPKGGFIAMRVSLQLITDVSLAKLALEDQQVAETQYSVIIKTASGKPSQVVFGFSSLREATRLKALLKENK